MDTGQAAGHAGGAVRRGASDWSALTDRAGGESARNNWGLSPITGTTPTSPRRGEASESVLRVRAEASERNRVLALVPHSEMLAQEVTLKRWGSVPYNSLAIKYRLDVRASPPDK